MIVTEASRGLGVGTGLLDAAEKWAHGVGAKGIRVDVLSENLEGREFYERRGYRMFAARYGKAVT